MNVTDLIEIWPTADFGQLDIVSERDINFNVSNYRRQL